MPLVLRIENVDTLPDGGPVFVEIDRRGIDIGRDTYLDWTLPDPERFISGKHCEIHFRDGGYWLHDVSTNGTTVNNNPGRVTEPHCLAHGDRIHIGPYIVMAELSGVEAGPDGPGPIPDKGGTSIGNDPWGSVESPAEAIDRRDFTARSQPPSRSGPADLSEENISWGFGDVSSATPPPSQSSGAEWSEPPATTPSAPDAADWGAPPVSPTPPPPAASPPPASPTADSVDWGAAPAADTPSGGSPWDMPEPEQAAQPVAAPPPEPAPTPPAPPAEQPAEPIGNNPFLDEPMPEPDPAPAESAPVEPAPTPEAIPTEPFSEPPESPAPEPRVAAQPPAPEKPAEPAQGLGQQWAGGASPEPVPPPSSASPPATPPTSEPLAPTAAVAAEASAQSGSFIAAFERGAGLPAGAVSGRSDEQLGEELGQLFHTVTQALQAMLLARAETKSAMRSTERTMIGALENNPLKFSPTPEDAMRIMFGERTRSYLDAAQTVEQSFADLQKHQMLTFGAMQSALQVLIEDLDPESIAGATAKDGGLAALVSSRRAKFWDTYVERFNAKSAHHDRGLIDAFMILFAEMYDRQG